MVTTRERIAIVDDETDLASVFCDALNWNNIKAIAFTDARDAIKYLLDHHSEFTLIITDWRMPAMTGFELAKLVKQMDSEIRIVVMSAFELEKDIPNEIQIREYLQKPIHMDKFVETVKHLLIQPKVISDQI